MTIYVLHLDPPLAHARHYIGFTPDEDPDRRVREHLSGGTRGSPLIRAAVAAGSKVTLAHVFEGESADRTFERRLKTRRDTRQWCPLCGVHTRKIPSCETSVVCEVPQ